jgi:hypothetical protein
MENKEKINFILGLVLLIVGIFLNIYFDSWAYYTVSAICFFVSGLAFGSYLKW